MLKNLIKHHPELCKAAKLSLPTFFAYFPLGIVFGILFVHLKFPWYLAPMMSAFVYGGSVQFVALGMMVQHNAIYTILFATVFVGLRNAFYGLSLIERYQGPWLSKYFLIFTLVDATYATLAANPPEPELNDKKFCLYLSLLIGLYWVIGTLLGAVSASWMPNFSGLAFILPCFFMVLVIENYLVHRSITPLIVPIIFSIIAYLILPTHYLLLAVIASVIFIAFAHTSKDTKA